MFVCIPSKDNGLLYNILEEEAGSHSNYDIIPTIKHPRAPMHKNTCFPLLGTSQKFSRAVSSGQGTKLISNKSRRAKINCKYRMEGNFGGGKR